LGLGSAEVGLARLEQHLGQNPFRAPEKPELDQWGLGVRELAAAERSGRLVRLAADVVLLPTGPAQAMRVLAALPQPFTTSQARQALETTRRVAIPLLEHLDRRGWTIRLDAGHRQVKRG
jgi:selenocysteine-specific elongation factor